MTEETENMVLELLRRIRASQERTELDITYARTFSFKTDLYIIWKTFFSLWQKENV